ncbi:MAG: xanthine phosphoribosyltransferase [Clostridia bacterium]|nr:xanthine phosphoribosyltransferase [Clostridia bacterium]
MKQLEDKIRKVGRPLSEHVLLVDMFLNHQVDCTLMRDIGREFARLFADAGITRVVTIEASGIAPSVMTALELNVPLVILKKARSVILDGGVIQTEVFSFTKQSSYQLTLKPEFVHVGDRVLLIDDFLANGEAATGAAELIKKAGGTVAGIGIVISKNFQPGLKRLRESGYRVEALAEIEEMGEGYVRFAGEAK